MPGQSPEPEIKPDITPLTFLQAWLAAGIVAGSEPEFRQGQAVLRRLVRPLYQHYTTAAYGAWIEDKPVGWLYLRGWHQVLCIDALDVHPEWRGQGIDRALLAFAEMRAAELKRAWLGAVLAAERQGDLLALLESHGFSSGCRRQFEADPARLAALALDQSLPIRPVAGGRAHQEWRRLQLADLSAGDQADDPLQAGFLAASLAAHPSDRCWVVTQDGRSAACLAAHTRKTLLRISVASEPAWWDSPQLLATLRFILDAAAALPALLALRLGSSGHHEAAKARLLAAGFAETPAPQVRLLKRITPVGPPRGQ
jgi:GNAT superfamily N-acetyltransferase